MLRAKIVLAAAENKTNEAIAAERRLFDVKPYLAKGVFSELKDEPLFRSVHVCFDTVEWANGADVCPEVLYAASEPVELSGTEYSESRAGDGS